MPMFPSIRDLLSGARSLAGIVSRRYVLAGPRSIALAISDVCDTNCIMCSCHSPLLDRKPAGPDIYMEPHVFETILRECRAMGTFRVVLGGNGEPSLHPRFDEMLRLMSKLGMEPYVLTNGLALDGERARLWSSIHAHYRLSIHAGDEGTFLAVHSQARPGQFERLTRAMKLLSSGGPARISAMHVISKANFRHVRAMIDHAHEVGLREVLFRPVRAVGELAPTVLSSEEEDELHAELKQCLKLAGAYSIRTNIHEYLKTSLWIDSGLVDTAQLYRKIPCYIGWLYAEFDRDGTMRPCLHSRRAMGRAGERTIREMWNSPAYREFRRESRAMPRAGRLVSGCACSQCCMAKYNVNIYELLRLKSFRYGQA
jgi:MoaA/NifB/PqqE/SkfB family radical SAM enzyme